jgi:carbamoyl-phosphate synthase large subunit
VQDKLREQVRQMALELGVKGLMNTQFAIKGEEIYILEVNPRASRTVPYVSKSISVPLAKVAARCMAGRSLADQGVTKEVIPSYYSVKEAVFPFIKFQGVDPILGPEMKSTGEVMGVGRSLVKPSRSHSWQHQSYCRPVVKPLSAYVKRIKMRWFRSPKIWLR